jgi:hypothetical protein
VAALFVKICGSLDPGSIAIGFLSLGVLEGELVQSNPHTLEELKQNIELCISNVAAETLHRVASDLRDTENESGGNFQYLI